MTDLGNVNYNSKITLPAITSQYGFHRKLTDIVLAFFLCFCLRQDSGMVRKPNTQKCHNREVIVIRQLQLTSLTQAISTPHRIYA